MSVREVRFFRQDRRRYPWLSNFYEVWFTAFGMKWISVEHCYQAMKSVRPEERRMVQACPTAREAKRKGRFVLLRPDWEDMRESVMRTALNAKFRSNDELREKLIATKDAKLVEDNPRDPYWGVGAGSGKNRLGVLLMELRKDLRDGKELKP